MFCEHCEQVTSYFFEKTYFWVFAPNPEALTKLSTHFSKNQLKHKTLSDNCVTFDIDLAQFEQTLKLISAALTPPELHRTKITTAESDSLDFEAMGRIIPADALVTRFESIWLYDTLSKANYTTYYQPIVSINGDKTEIFAHEALFRVFDADNNIFPTGRLFEIAGTADLLFTLDLLARRSAVEKASQAGLDSRIFINFNPSSVYDPNYCLRETAKAIKEMGYTPADIVFEITETHKILDLNHLEGILNYYRKAGFGVALDDLGSGWSGLNLVHTFKPDFIKLDLELVRDVHQDNFKQSIVKHMIELAHEIGIKVISEGIETEEEARWLIENGSDLLQGYFFGRPADLAKIKSNNEQAPLVTQFNTAGLAS